MLKRMLSIAVLALGMTGLGVAAAGAGNSGDEAESRPKHEMRHGQGHGSQGGYGHHGQHGHHGEQGRHRGMMMKKMMAAHGEREPTLKLEAEGKGREIKFECRASMSECLEAFDKVRGALMDRRGDRDAEGD